MSDSLPVVDAVAGFVAKELVGDPDLRLDAETDLLGSGLVDSLGVMSLVFFLEQEFGIEIPAEDVIIDHFGTPGAIDDYLSARRS